MSVWRTGREVPSGLAARDDWAGWNFLEGSGKTCRTDMGKMGGGGAQERQLVAVLASAGLSWGRGEGH